MAIVLLCESAQQFRALMMILQYHKTLSMISMMLSQCYNALSHVVSETSSVLSPALFRQSIYYFPVNLGGVYLTTAIAHWNAI